MSSSSTTTAGCTTTSGWNEMAYWCCGAVLNSRPDTASVNPWRYTLRIIRWTTPCSRVRSPKGECGADQMILWDSGTYDTEKFRHFPEKG